MITHIRRWWEARKRREAVSDVRAELRALEDTLNRSDLLDIPRPEAAETYLSQLRELEARAATASRHDLDDIVAKAETLGQLRAYFCPAHEVADEGHLAMDQMTEWGVRKERVAALVERLGAKLSDQTRVDVARSALNAVYAEFDSWSWYTDNSETKSRWAAWFLLAAILTSFFVANLLVSRPSVTAVLLGLLLAGVGGSCASVITKIGPLAVTSEFEASIREIPIRIGTGVAGSVIGAGLLAWGFAPIAIHGETYADLLATCAAERCPASGVLTLVAISGVLGFSERVLTWVSDAVAPTRS